MLRFFSFVVLTLISFTVMYCDFDIQDDVSQNQSISWDEFKSSVNYIEDMDAYVVEKDLPVYSLKALREYYDNNYGPNRLALHKLNYDSPDRWSASQQKNLTYCVEYPNGKVDEKYVEWLHEQGANLMDVSAGRWEEASKNSINFVHVSSEDSRCTAYNDNVLFNVSFKYMPPTSYSGIAAMAFFPSLPRSKRQIVLNIALWTDKQQIVTNGFSPQDIVTHELGHALGFVHEHGTQYAAGKTLSNCSEYRWNASYQLTEYDKYSIMHYPHCRLDYNSYDSKFFRITELDKEGIWKVYGNR